jgi:hypothetical protein
MSKLNECGCGCGGAVGGCQKPEGKMAKHQAMECAEDAQDVANMIEETDNLPEWLEAKITLAADYMNKVKDYITHHVRNTEPEPSYNKLPRSGDDFKPTYPMIIQTQDEMKDLIGEIVRKINEKAPPGKEKVVKAIKKELGKDGLTNKEKAIAYATAWSQHNKEK